MVCMVNPAVTIARPVLAVNCQIAEMQSYLVVIQSFTITGILDKR